MRPLCPIPGCQDVFVLQLFHFSRWHGDDNVVNVVHTLSLAFANKALEMKHGPSWNKSNLAHQQFNVYTFKRLFDLIYHFTYFTLVDYRTLWSQKENTDTMVSVQHLSLLSLPVCHSRNITNTQSQRRQWCLVQKSNGKKICNLGLCFN